MSAEWPEGEWNAPIWPNPMTSHNAREPVEAIPGEQVRSAFQRWQNLEEEKARVADDLKELFAEQKALGHDTKAMRAAFRLKVKLDEARPADAEHEALVDTYLAALEAPRATRAYARENIEQSDVSPRLIKQVVDGMQTEAGRAALLTAVDIMIEREEAEENSPETATRPGQDVQSPSQRAMAGENLDVTGGESAATNSETHERPSTNDEPSPEAGPQAEASPAGTGTGTLADREGRSEGEAASADLPTNSISDQPTTGGHDAQQDQHVNLDRRRHFQNQEITTPTEQVGGEHEVATGSGSPATHLVTGEGTAHSALPDNVTMEYVMEYVPPVPMRRLPFAHCFPDLSKAEYDRLEKDIAVNRVQSSIIRLGDVIVDGWNRYTIARRYGFAYPVQEIDAGRDVLLDVIGWQRASRDFTTAQEKKIAADLAKEFPHRTDEIMTAFGLTEAMEAAE